MMKSETSVFSVFFFKEVLSGSSEGRKNTDVLKVALKQGTATRNSKEFTD